MHVTIYVQAGTFRVWTADLGDISALDIGQTTECKPEWHISQLTVRKGGADECALFKCDRFIPCLDDSAEISGLRLAPVRGGHYTIATSTSHPAGTLHTAHVQDRPTPVLKLTAADYDGVILAELVRSDQPKPFCAGQLDTFEFDLPYFEQLHAVQVELPPRSRTIGWHLDKILVKKNDSQGHMWLFEVAEWVYAPISRTTALVNTVPQLMLIAHRAQPITAYRTHLL